MPVRILMLLPILLAVASATAAETRGVDRDLERRFPGVVRPFLDAYCLDCHGPHKPKGDLDLSPYTTTESVAKDLQRWEQVLERLEAGEMPPRKAGQHPTAAESRDMIRWIQAFRSREAHRHAGDPGPVPARRLSNAEYDYSIRDLTGVDLRPTREFPVDPANPEGFDNSGESLTMSPALVKKYLEAARKVSQHAVLTLDGIAFAEHPMMVHTDRDKYGILRIVGFYERQPTDYADYFAAAWRYRYRAALGQPRAKLAEIAAESGVSSNYLATVWKVLNTREDVGPIAHLQSLWNALPAPAPRSRSAPVDVRPECVAMRDFVVTLRQKIRPEVPNLSAPGLNPSAQALVLWKDRQMAAQRRTYDTNALQIDGRVPAASEARNTAASYNAVKVKKTAPEPDPNLAVPSDPVARARYETAFARFADVFPDAFYVKERGRTFVDPEEEKANGNVGRLLSAGLHNQTGYFRDDGPLCEMILDEAGRRELDHLWDEFLMVASVPQRMHQSTVYFERTDSRFLSDAEFDFARAEDKDCTSEAKVQKLAELYYAKAQRTGATEQVLAAIEDHFQRVNREIRRIETLERESEPKHREALVRFAQLAYRRPLTSDERESLLAFYRTLRDQDGLTHDEAIRDCLASVLVSPHFCYRIDLVEAAGSGTSGSNAGSPSSRRVATVPLSDGALASRLSYFLWSSLPDDALLAHAAAGDLHRPKVLIAEARRMMADDRIRGLAVEFGGHWLDFRRFEEHNAVDRARFPAFNDVLRQAMFEEPVRFLQDIIQSNRPVTLLLDAPYTFVNPALAQHYGLPVPTTGSNAWFRVDEARSVGRGGLLPMSVFLTANSPGLRTSPVKRGNWVARRILGERIPPPPAAVPELPSDEAKLGELTLRETLARHRADPACAACHKRFDSLGLVFEGFGPIGERRTVDLSGHPVDTHTAFPKGGEGSGVEGLRAYIHEKRQDDFLDNLCRKLLGYALGRSLILSDEITVRDMRARLAANGDRFGSLVETIVTSPQFLNRRNPNIAVSP